jgi:hypothetical protein
MTFEEHGDKLLNRPPKEHEARWRMCNYALFQGSSRELTGIRDEAFKRQRESKEPRQKVRTRRHKAPFSRISDDKPLCARHNRILAGEARTSFAVCVSPLKSLGKKEAVK